MFGAKKGILLKFPKTQNFPGRRERRCMWEGSSRPEGGDYTKGSFCCLAPQDTAPHYTHTAKKTFLKLVATGAHTLVTRGGRPRGRAGPSPYSGRLGEELESCLENPRGCNKGPLRNLEANSLARGYVEMVVGEPHKQGQPALLSLLVLDHLWEQIGSYHSGLEGK